METDWRREIATGRVRVIAQQGVIVAGSASGGVWEIDTISVAPEAQRLGVGRRLMADSEALAREAGCRSISLYTNIAMEGPLHWYPRLGYRVAGRRIVDGFDRIYFERAL